MKNNTTNTPSHSTEDNKVDGYTKDGKEDKFTPGEWRAYIETPQEDEYLIVLLRGTERRVLCKVPIMDKHNTPMLAALSINQCWNEYDTLKAENENLKQVNKELVEALKGSNEMIQDCRNILLGDRTYALPPYTEKYSRIKEIDELISTTKKAISNTIK